MWFDELEIPVGPTNNEAYNLAYYISINQPTPNNQSINGLTTVV